jgi:hypothetical protein
MLSDYLFELGILEDAYITSQYVMRVHKGRSSETSKNRQKSDEKRQMKP